MFKDKYQSVRFVFVLKMWQKSRPLCPPPDPLRKFKLKSDRVNLDAPASPIQCLLYLPNVWTIQYKLGPERLTQIGNSYLLRLPVISSLFFFSVLLNLNPQKGLTPLPPQTWNMPLLLHQTWNMPLLLLMTWNLLLLMKRGKIIFRTFFHDFQITLIFIKN